MENARLTALCEPNCTAEDFRRIGQQAAMVERAADLAEVAKRGVITPDQATRLAQTLLELVPGYGSGESVLQLMDDARRQLDELAVRTGMYGASARSENDVRRSRAAPRRWRCRMAIGGQREWRQPGSSRRPRSESISDCRRTSH